MNEKATILVVDDEIDIRSMLHQAITSENMTVRLPEISRKHWTFYQRKA